MTKVNEDAFLNPYKERLVEADGQNMYVPKAGFWEQAGAGFGEGLDFTSIALLSDLGLKARRSMNPLDAIEESDWNESHPYWQEDIEWEQDLTLEVARNIYFERNESANYEKLIERGGGGGMFTRGMGLFAGAMLDPINLVAAPASAYVKAGLLGKMAMAGAANFVAEGALQTVAYSTQRERGEELGVGDAALNLGFAAALGAAFPVGGNVIGRLFKMTRAGRMKGSTPQDNPSIARDSYSRDVEANAKFQSGQSGQSTITRIDNTDFNTIDSVNVTTTGRVADEGTVQVTNNKDGSVVITGSNADIVKILPALSTRLDNYDNIVIKSKEGVEVSTTAADIQTAQQTIQELVPEVKAELDLDPMITSRPVELEGKKYEIEVDENGDVTGVVYNVRKNGKRGAKKKPQEAENIIKAHQRNQQTRATEASENAPNQRQTDTIKTNKQDKLLQNKVHYKTTNQADATVGGKSKEFKDNYSNPQTAVRAITAETVVSTRTLYRAGFIVDNDNNLIDLLETSLDDIPADVKQRVAKDLGLDVAQLKAEVTPRGERVRTRIEDFKRGNDFRQQDLQARQEYVLCRRGAGTL